MQKHEKDWEDVLFYAAPQINSQIIEHLSYFLVQIFIGIKSLIFIECKI